MGSRAPGAASRSRRRESFIRKGYGGALTSFLEQLRHGFHHACDGLVVEFAGAKAKFAPPLLRRITVTSASLCSCMTAGRRRPRTLLPALLMPCFCDHWRARRGRPSAAASATICTRRPCSRAASASLRGALPTGFDIIARTPPPRVYCPRLLADAARLLSAEPVATRKLYGPAACRLAYRTRGSMPSLVQSVVREYNRAPAERVSASVNGAI